MPNYFDIKGRGIAELKGATIEGEGKKGLGNAAEQFIATTLNIPVKDVKEITKEEYDSLDNE